MNIAEVFFARNTPTFVKHAILTMVERAHSDGVHVDQDTQVLTPTDTNDDINGSQHVSNGGTDFTYRDVTDADITDAHSLGVYEYFSGSRGCYTGHYYHGNNHFTAVVINPPAYAAAVYV